MKLNLLGVVLVFFVSTFWVHVILIFGGADLSFSEEVGLLFLGVVPTTISTAVAFTARAKGTVVNTLCVVLVSNFLAIVLVPIYMNEMIDGSFSINPLPIISKIALLMLLPLLIGQLVVQQHKPIQIWAKKYSKTC